VQPFIEQSKKRVINWLILISLFALSLGALFAWRINSAVNKLTVFAEKTGAGERLTKPRFRVFYEYRKLSHALESMRDKLDGKQYVEDYVQTLTHELKSPLSAIKGASEILQLPVTEQKRALFAKNIEQESTRMQQLIDQLLELAKLEKQPDINFQLINLKTLVETTLNACLVNTSDKELHIDNQIPADLTIKGDPFLLRQGLINLLDNACDFTPPKHTIRVSIEHTSEAIKLSVFNQGAAIPDYALDRVTQRFYSLPRSNGQKSTGLGLSFVEQIMQLHKGRFDIKNVKHGVCATLTFYAS
jgi:two-component system sensor histidine kinase CreC